MSKGDAMMRKRGLLLRRLYERGAIDPNSGVAPDILQEDLKVSEQDFQSLHVHLLDSGLVNGVPLLWLTDRGLNEVLGAQDQFKRSKEMEIYEIQRGILETIARLQEHPNKFVEDTVIAEGLGLGLQEIQDHLVILEQKGYIVLSKTFGPKYSANLTAEGRLELRHPGYMQQQTPSPQVTYNILNLDRSTVGTINTGYIEQLDVAMAQMHEEGEPELANGLKELTEAIVKSQEIAGATKDELIEHLSFLVEQARTSKEERRLAVSKTTFDAITRLICAAPTLLTLWNRVEPIVRRFLGV